MNPYEPPRAASLDFSPNEHAQLVQIARFQRAINLLILAHIGLYGVALPLQKIPVLGPMVLGIAGLAVGIASIVAVVRLANVLHGTGVAVLCAILMFVPCLNLLTLLVLNSGATSRLRKAGYRVGLLGADPDEVARSPRP